MCFAPQRRALFRHFFDIWTSKSGPRPSVFNTFDLEMCFAPQRRALFRHLNFQKWSGAEVFCTFWLGNVLRATTACTFSTSQLPKVLRAPRALYIFTWKCASRHNGVQFFIAPVASWLRTRRFSEPTFRPSGATNHWKKHSVSRLSYLFAHLHLLSSDLFSSDSSHLCFSTVHIVGSFTSKLPSIITEPRWTYGLLSDPKDGKSDFRFTGSPKPPHLALQQLGVQQAARQRFAFPSDGLQ